MKKIVYLAVVAALGFAAGCTKEASDIAPETGATFSITVSTPATKTVFDGATYDVVWADDDELGAYIVGGDKAGVYKFTKDSGKDNSFSTTDFTPEEGVEYTYYVLYPYDAEFTVTEGKSNAVVKISASGAQSDLNAADHIATPLYGTATAEGTAAPEIKLNHAASVMKINVANYSGAELAISKVGLLSIDKSAVMAGTFSIDFATGELTASKVSNEAAVTLETKTLANEASADFYVAVAPFATTADLSVVVNDDEFEKNGVSYDFNAGSVYKTSVTCGTPEVAVEVAGATSGALTQTLEDENVYANLLSISGEFDIAVQLGGSKYYLCPADATFQDGEAVKVSLKKTAETHWSLPEAEGEYRLVYNKLDGTLTIYSPENEFNDPYVMRFNYAFSTDRVLSRTVTSGEYYIYLNNGDDGWRARYPINFNTSLADPWILVMEEGKTFKVPAGGGFNVKLGWLLTHFIYEDKGTAGDDPENDDKGEGSANFTSRVAAFSPGREADVDLNPNVWMPMTPIVSNKRWKPSEAVTVSKLVIDIRNSRIFVGIAE